MATGQNINTYFKGTWHKGNAAVISAADHGAWLGSNVFDGARYFNGVAPDLLAHCERVNNSAQALMLKPTVSSKARPRILRRPMVILHLRSKTNPGSVVANF